MTIDWEKIQNAAEVIQQNHQAGVVKVELKAEGVTIYKCGKVLRVDLKDQFPE